MTDRQSNVLFSCDVIFGSSGAPVFSHLNELGRVVSVISGMAQIKGKKVTLGMYLPPLIAQLKTKLYSTAYTLGNLPAPKVHRLGVAKCATIRVRNLSNSAGLDPQKFLPTLTLSKRLILGFHTEPWSV